MASTQRQYIVRTDIGDDDRQKFELICQKRGMTQVSAISRMVIWLAHQDEVIQTEILNTPTDASSKALRVKLLKHIAAGQKS